MFMQSQTRETCLAQTWLNPWATQPVIMAGLALLSLTSCRHDTTSLFPLALGFQPLEPCSAALPAPVAGDPYPEVQTSITGNRDGHDWAHSKAYVHATLAEVWAGMQIPAVCRIHGTNWWTVKDVGLEPFPMSFAIHYSAGPSYYSVEWEDTYRGGVLAGTADAATVYGMRGQKTWGTTSWRYSQSRWCARLVQAEDQVVALGMVGWLSATDWGNPMQRECCRTSTRDSSPKFAAESTLLWAARTAVQQRQGMWIAATRSCLAWNCAISGSDKPAGCEWKRSRGAAPGRSQRSAGSGRWSGEYR